MNIPFPTNKKEIIQTNRSNVLGNMWSSFNLDLQSNLGVVRVGTKMKLNTKTGDTNATNLGVPVAFKQFDARMFALGDTRIFKNTGNDLITPFVEDTSNNVPTTFSADVSDFEIFSGALAASTQTQIVSKAANGAGTGAWTLNRATVNTGFVHKLRFFPKRNRLYFTDLGTQIKSFASNWTAAAIGDDYTLQVGDFVQGGVISTISSNSQSIWIGIVQPLNASSINSNARGCIIEWDGLSAGITNQYILDAQGCVAILIDNDIPYAMDSNGVLLQYSGSSFDEIGRLPLDKQYLTNATSALNNRFIHPNGLISTKNSTIKALINNLVGDSAGSIVENLPSGIWEWSKENGFSHNGSFTYQQVFSSTIVDYGQNRISRAGALVNANLYNTSSSGRSTIIAGANYFTDATTVLSGIFVDSPIPTDNVSTPEGLKKGYFATTFAESEEIQESWSRFWVTFKRFISANDKIIFKYRNTEVDPIEATISLINPTTFTTATNITAYGVVGNTGKGGEVEIVQGCGSGSCGHITAISGPSGGLYTVTVDEDMTPIPTGTSKARFQKWIWGGEVTNAKGLEQSYQQFGIENSNDTRFQSKVCMNFTNNGELHKALVATNTNIKIQN